MLEAMAHFAVEPFAAYFALGDGAEVERPPAPGAGAHPAHRRRRPDRDPPVVAREILDRPGRRARTRRSSAADPRFATRLARIDNYDDAGRASSTRRFQRRPLAEWVERLGGPRRAVRADQQRRRDVVRGSAGAAPGADRAGRRRRTPRTQAVRPAVQFDGQRATSVRPAPLLDEHGAAIRAQLAASALAGAGATAPGRMTQSQRSVDALPHHARRQLPAARLADRPREARRPLSAARARDASCGASRSRTWPRRRTTRRCSRSARRRRPGSTSSPTARSGARATRTASPPRSKASTSTTPAPRSTAPATRTRCRASSGRSAAGTRSRSTT